MTEHRVAAGNRPSRVLLTLLVACGPGPIMDEGDDGPTVDANVYAQGFCSLRCWRLGECGLAAGVPAQECEMDCVDEALAQLAEDPCWAECIEQRRCLVRWSACEEVLEEDAPTGPGTPCEEQTDDLDACE